MCQVFEKLKNKADPAVLKHHQDTLNARGLAQQQKAQERLAELVRGW